MKLFGWLIIAGAIAGLISGGGNLAYFIEWQSLLWVCLVIIGGVWVSFGPMDAMKAIDAAFISRPNLNDEQVTQYSSVLKLAYQLAWGGGIVGTFAGLIIMLQNMDDPSMIGPGMAVSLLCAIYGAFFAEFIFAPLHYSLINTALDNNNSKPDGSPTRTNQNSQTPEPDADSSDDLAHAPTPKHLSRITGMNNRTQSLGAAAVFLMMLMFFILLTSISEIKSEDVWRSKADEVKQSFDIDEPCSQDETCEDIEP